MGAALGLRVGGIVGFAEGELLGDADVPMLGLPDGEPLAFSEISIRMLKTIF